MKKPGFWLVGEYSSETGESIELGTVMVGEAVSETGVSSSLVSRLFPLVFGQCFALFHTG